MSGSNYVNSERRDYSLYVLQDRAIPHAADGMKAAARRVMWIARDGKSYKSATLAGATMPLHPHQSPEGAVNTLAAHYGNNIPLLHGKGSFGTLLNPTAYGASRYTSVKVSQFAKDVVFRDIEIIPMQENYDGTLMEPKHFLPLVPVVLLNPQTGIAVGFASNILPRDLGAIVKSQIAYLENKDFYEELPSLKPINQQAKSWIEDEEGKITKFVFHGSFEKLNATTIEITNLPYGMAHEKYVEYLSKLEDEEKIQEFEDNSKDQYNITVRFKKGSLSSMSDNDILSYLNLINSVSENMTMIDFDGKRVLKTSYGEFIQMFCDWRLKWYVQRYERLANNVELDMQRYRDILRAIDKNVGGAAKKIGSRSELKDFLTEIGIVHIDYIADLPVYRFTEEEKKKVEQKLAEATVTLKEYNALLKSEPKRRKVFIDELNEVLQNYRKGAYNVGS